MKWQQNTYTEYTLVIKTTYNFLNFRVTAYSEQYFLKHILQ